MQEVHAALDEGQHLNHVVFAALNALCLQIGHQHGGQLAVVFLQHILMVEPFAFFVVEFGASLAATLYIESFYQFVHREHFLFGAGIPAQERQKVDDGFGEIAGLAIALADIACLRIFPIQGENGEIQPVAVALGELALAIGFEQQRQMGEAGHGVFPAKSAVKQDMQRCRRQPLLSSDNVANLHQMVVHHIGQVVGGQIVGTLVQHLVVEHIRFVMHLAAYHVLNINLLVGVNFETHRIQLAACQPVLHFFSTEAERILHLHTGMGIILEIGVFGMLGFQLGRRIESIVGLALGQELVYVSLVDFTTLRLAIGAVFTAETHAFVELDAQPCERFHNVGLGSRHKAFAVGIFDTKYHIAAQILGEQIVI